MFHSLVSAGFSGLSDFSDKERFLLCVFQTGCDLSASMTHTSLLSNHPCYVVTATSSFRWFENRLELRQSESLCFLNLNSVNQLIFVMVKCGVLFEVRTKLLSVLRASASKGCYNNVPPPSVLPIQIYSADMNFFSAALGVQH
jgi:hypothetical protein